MANGITNHLSNSGWGGVPPWQGIRGCYRRGRLRHDRSSMNAGGPIYDMAPWYGLGLAERRYGNFLHNKERSEYVLPRRWAS